MSLIKNDTRIDMSTPVCQHIKVRVHTILKLKLAIPIDEILTIHELIVSVERGGYIQSVVMMVPSSAESR